MRPPSVFSTRRQFLQNSAALFASGAVPFADASADAETSGQTGISFVSDQEKRRRELWDLLGRSEEHTSELQSPCNLVCRLLLEKKKSTIVWHPPQCSTCAQID